MTNFRLIRRRTAIARRQSWLCRYCGRKMDKTPGGHSRPRGVTLDHVVPKRLGGTDHPDNLAACCYECNQLKGGDCKLGGEGAA